MAWGGENLVGLKPRLLPLSCVSVAQLCPALWDAMDCGPPASSELGILQARILEWVTMPFSRDLPDSGIRPGSPALQTDSLRSESPFWGPS